MVVRCGKTPREALNRSKQMLQSGGANILGAILNQVEMQGSGYYQGYYQQALNEQNADSKKVISVPSAEDVADSTHSPTIESQVFSATEPEVETMKSNGAFHPPQARKQKRRRK